MEFKFEYEMSIFLKIETKKSMMSIELSPEEVKNQYNILLDVIRDMEFDSKSMLY